MLPQAFLRLHIKVFLGYVIFRYGYVDLFDPCQKDCFDFYVIRRLFDIRRCILIFNRHGFQVYCSRRFSTHLIVVVVFRNRQLLNFFDGWWRVFLSFLSRFLAFWTGIFHRLAKSLLILFLQLSKFSVLTHVVDDDSYGIGLHPVLHFVEVLEAAIHFLLLDLLPHSLAHGISAHVFLYHSGSVSKQQFF